MITESEAIQIAQTLVSKNFPELARKRIRYRFVAGKRYDFYMAVRWNLVGYVVTIEQEILQFSSQAFTG